MKKLYATNKALLSSKNLHKFLVMAIILISTVYSGYGQVRVPFSPRTSSSTPSTTVYNVKGDFSMIGNTNLTLVNYSDTRNNNTDMVYVDIDGDTNTWNSSSAYLDFSTENGAIPECSNIIYAGIYWTGRADTTTDTNADGDNSHFTFQASQEILTGGTTTQQFTDTDEEIFDNDNIPNTNYTLNITETNSGPGSSGTWTVRYLFTSSGIGDTVEFIYRENSGSNNETLHVSVNNGTESVVSTNSIDNDDAFLSSTYQIFSDSDYTLEVSRLGRQGTDRAYVDITYFEDVPNTTTITKDFDKRKIQIKGPTATNYTELTAADNEIYYPNGTDGNMFSAYTEITDYVIANGIGDYFVADIATVEGNGGSIGFYGGWGMVIVYENSKMNWRDITVFDGHAYVASSTTSNEIPVNGFNAVQFGDVNVKLGLMAGEGDVGVSGDYFEIQRQVDGVYQRLSHTGNTTGNFFNSSIQTGGNGRTPNLLNNSGVDISMFNIDNTDNDVIDNNQTSTTLRYGSTGDTYVIFNVTFAVDAYIPEPEGVLTNTSIDGNPPGPGNTTLEPSEDADYTIQIKNTGTETINNTVITIPIPDSVNPTNLNIDYNLYLPLTSSSNPNIPIYDSNVGANGSIVWNLGTLPVPSNSDDVLADLSFSLTVTTDCTVLSNLGSNANVAVNGTISGVGAISTIPFETDLIQGYETTGVCIGEPIPTPSLIAIDYLDYINQGPSIACPSDIAQNVDAGVAGAVVTFTNPIGTDNAPGAVTTQIAGPISGSVFPIGVTTVTFQVEDDCGNTAECSFDVTVTDNEDPTISCPAPINVNVDAGANGAVVTYTAPVGTDNAGGTVTTTQTTGLSSGSLFPVGTTTNTFEVTDAAGNTAECSFDVTVTDNEDPTISCPAPINVNVDAGANGAVVTYTAPVGTDNAGGTVTTTQTTGLSSGSLFPVGTTTNTFEVTDAAGNTAECSFDVTVTDNEDPTISCPAPINVNVDAGANGAVVTYTAPVGTDNAGGTVTTTQTTGLSSGSLFPVGTTTNTFEVTDAAGNTAECSFDVTVTDNEDPTISCPAPINVNVDAGANGAVVAYTAPVGTDNAGGTVTTTQTTGLSSGSLFPVGTTTNTFEVTDAAGNTAECSFDVTVTDNEDPTISCPAPINVNVDAGANGAVVAYTAPVGTDNAGGTVTTTQTTGLSSGSLFPVGTTTNTFEVTDAAGNTAECSFDVTVTDNEDPTISCPAPINVNVDAGANGAVVTYTAPVGTDNAGGTVTTTQTTGLSSGSLFPVGTTTNTFEVTDAAGNTAECSFDVTVTDNEDPTISCPAPINVNVDAGANGAVVTYTAPVGTDNAGGTVTTTQTTGLSSGSLFPVGTTTNTFEVTDAAGNTAECSFDVTVTDNEDPTISCPAPINVNVDAGANGAVVTYTAPVGTDNAGGTVTTTQTTGLSSGSLFPVGTTTNTFEVTDAAGNTAECSFDVTVTDNEDPTISCPAPINVNVDAGANGAVVTYTAPVGTDNAGGTVTTTQTTGLSSGSLFPVGTTTNTFEVTDAAGNTAECSFDVTVTDNEDPTISCPAPINVNVDAGANGAVVTYTAPVGTDNAGGTVTTTQTTGLSSGSLFPVGTTTNTFEVTDAAGNTAECSFDVTVTDNEDPTISCPAPINVNVDAGANGAVVTYTAPVGTDNAGGTVTTTQTTGLSSGSLFPVGTTTNTFEVTDAAGNTAECSFDVTVTDNEDPTISCPAPINVNVDAGANGAVVTYTAPVGTDNAGGTVTTTQTTGLSSGSLFPVGTTTNTFEVTDAAGNTAECSFDVTVTDNEDPTISCPAPINVNVDAGANGAVVTYTAPVGTDNAGGTVTTTQTTGLSSGSLFPVGTTTNTFEVTDAAGNTAECSFDVTVTDNEDPTISCPAPINVNVDAGANGAVVTYTAPVGTDNAGGTVTTTQTTGLSSGSLFPVGTTTNTFEVTDAAGNTAECSFDVTVTDNEDPTISCPAPINVNVDAGANGAVVTYTAPVGTDNAGGTVTTTQTTGLSSGSLFPVGTTTNTFEVTDAAGNTAECSFDVTVTDNEDPTISCPAPINVNVDAGANGAVVTYTAPVGTDNAGGTVTTTQTTGLSSGSLFPVGTTTNTFEVTDAAGNTAECSFDVTVTDNEDPTISCPAPINVNVDAGICGAIVTYTAPVGTDNAGGTVTTTQTTGLSSGSLFPVGTTTNTFEVTDDAGNTAECSFDVTVTDNEPPVIVCPQDITQTADTDQCSADISIVDPTATDNCSTIFIFNGTRSDNLALTDPYPVGLTTITWTATDEANNTSIPCVQTINITDDEAPVFVETLPVDITVECDQVPVASVLTAIDNCNSANVTFNEERTNGTCISDYALERTWVATDVNGNTTTHTQTITVQDNTPPVLTLPASVSAECSDDLSPIAFGTATVTDNCDSNPVITFVDVTTTGICPGSFIITRTWTATDECGNTVSADQTISTSDTTAPEFDQAVLPQDLTIECNSVPDAETLTATDNCGTVTVQVNDTRTDGNCPNNYIITRVYTATDDCSNTNTHVQTITVQDITPPTFVEALPTANLVVECDAVPDAETLTAIDTCGSASVLVEDITTDGNCDNNYTIARTWTATDECGLTTTHTQIITVQDTTPPTFVEALPGDITVECDAVPTTDTLTATDKCGDATVEVNDVRTDGDCPNNYIILRTWTATDECGLMTTHTQTITVQDTTAPVPTSTFDETLNVSCTDIPDAPELEFTDNCSSNVVVVFNETNSFDENVLVDYEIVRTWTVRDECNNEEVYTQTLFVALDEVITEITAEDRCYDDGIVNLNDYIGDLNGNGVWELLEGDTAATLNENGVFDPSGLELSETFLPEDGGIDYEFRYTTTDNGCISITELTMNINADCVVLPCGENDVVVSKAVTPNGDAYNEFFEISGVELCGFQYEVQIFNRWGALIYKSDDYQNDWNGKAINSIGASGKVPNGTYYYIVILKNSGLNPITGPVYLGTK